MIDVSGRSVTAAAQTASSPGGSVSLNSGGALSVSSGAQLNVSGATGADAGSINVSGAGAVNFAGSVSGAATGGARGGIFALDAGSLVGRFDDLVGSVRSGGFSLAQTYRVRSGDLVLDAGQSLTANQVELVADSGNIQIGGTISAPAADLRGEHQSVRRSER